MSNTTDKKKLIIRTAMQLFASQGASATSMQQIAEASGMSKGSLYVHFKSKEELESSLFDYCFQMLQEHLMEIELQPDLGPRDKLGRQIEVMLDLVTELREFLLMQFKDWIKRGTAHTEPVAFKTHTTKLIHYGREKLEAVYGLEIQPYTGDLILIANGMIRVYIQMLFDARTSIPSKRMAAHLLGLLDVSADSLLRTRPEPLISGEMLEQWTDYCPEAKVKGRHPLLAVKELKEALNKTLPDPAIRQLALESLQVLEEEILEVRPRRVIVQGMLANLSSIPGLKNQLAELDALLQQTFS